MNEIKTFKFKDVELAYSTPDTIYQVTVNSNDLKTIFKLFYESNYHALEIVYIAPELKEICFHVFDTIKELISKKEIILARRLSDFMFESFTPLWNYYLLHNRHFLGTKLWQHICNIVWEWENENQYKIHKGTPYFFFGATQLMQGNIDSAFLLIYNAIEEDKRYSNQIGDSVLYEKMPAYSFSSLIIDNPNNSISERAFHDTLMVSENL